MNKLDEWHAKRLIKRIEKYERFIIATKNWIKKDKAELAKVMKKIDASKIPELI